MVKNRLEELQDLTELESAPLCDGDDDPLAFFNSLQDVIESIDKVKENVSELKVLQRTILLLANPDETKKQRVSDLQADIRRLAKKIRDELKRFQDETDNNGGQRGRVDPRVRLTQIKVQSKRFQDIWTDYSNSLVDYRDKTKKQLIRRCKITNNELSEEQIAKMLDEGNTNVFNTSILDETRLARQELTELQDRHDILLNVESGIKELNEMFNDISILVSQQGEMIDNIAKNTSEAGAYVKAGNDELRQGLELRKKARQKRAYLLLILLLLNLLAVFGFSAYFGLFSVADEVPTTPTPPVVSTSPVPVVSTPRTSTESTTFKIAYPRVTTPAP